MKFNIGWVWVWKQFMNFERCDDWMHFVSEKWTAIHALIHIDHCCVDCVNSFEKVNAVWWNVTPLKIRSNHCSHSPNHCAAVNKCSTSFVQKICLWTWSSQWIHVLQYIFAVAVWFLGDESSSGYWSPKNSGPSGIHFRLPRFHLGLFHLVTWYTWNSLSSTPLWIKIKLPLKWYRTAAPPPHYVIL